jgi:IclR family acetate operon transcriptional repressor
VVSEATVLPADEDDVARRAGGVQSVGRAFEILELLASSDGDMTLSAIGSASTLPLPTIHRLVRTLVSLGYVAQSESRSYVLAPGLIRLGEVANRQLGAMARPELVRLVEALGETANLAILDSDMVMYAAQAPSGHSMRMFTEVGRRAHLHNTGVGKAILATFPDERVRQIMDRQGLPRATERSIGTTQDLLEELQQIRERGYSIDDGEQEIGVRCFAVSIPSSPIPAAISVSGPNSRVDDGFGERAVPVLRAASARLSQLFAANSPSRP